MFIDEKDAKTNEHPVLDDDGDSVELDKPLDEDGSGDQIASADEPDGPEADQLADSSLPRQEAPAGDSADSDRNAGPETDDATEPGRGKKRPPKPKKERERRSDKEILERLFEKNEVILQLTKRNVRLETQIKELDNKRLRLAAEFENYRKRTRKEWELLKDQTKAEVLSEVLNVADDFERAFGMVEDQDDDFVQGIRLIYNNLISILESFGIRRMSSLGELFDPNLHMAVATIESREVKSNHVVEVIQEGYLMDDAVVRVAKVVIAK